MIGKGSVEEPERRKNLYLRRKVKNREINRPGSINKCLLALGADYDDVYRPVGGSLLRNRQTIYDRYSKREILEWVGRLWHECKIRYHPDRHLYNKEYYEEKFKQLQEVYHIAVKMLT